MINLWLITKTFWSFWENLKKQQPVSKDERLRCFKKYIPTFHICSIFPFSFAFSATSASAAQVLINCSCGIRLYSMVNFIKYSKLILEPNAIERKNSVVFRNSRTTSVWYFGINFIP